MAATKILFASQNPGKQREARQLLAFAAVQLVFPDEFSELAKLEVIEDAPDFLGNAGKKARAFAEASGLLAMADDSGIAVDALDGYPGVRSSRFVSDHQRFPQERAALLLELLEGQDSRQATFHTALCLFDPETEEQFCVEEKVRGSISHEERGREGFVYDYVFIPQGESQTWAELGSDWKNEHSPRKKAFQKIIAYLEEKRP